jgi:hypothetical protein
VEEPTARRAIPGAGGGRSTVDTADREYVERDERRWFGRREAPPRSSWVLTIRSCNASKSSRSPVHTTSSPSAVDAQLGFESGLAADNSDAKAVPHFNS